MRGLRTFLGLVVILGALGGYLYFVESKRTPGDSGPKKEKVFNVESDKIEEISIKAEAGEQTTLRKSGTSWQIVAPVTAKPDDAEVSGLTTNLSNLEMQSVVDENAADLKEFGLAEPRVRVTFKAGGQNQTLEIGNKTPPGSDLYAKRATDKKVFLIASFLDSTFNRKTFDLRDKTAIRVDRDKLDALEVTTPDRTLRFAKANNEWQLTAPTPGRADFTAVEALTGRIAGLQMKSIAEAEPKDLKKYGLDKPTATVKIGSGSSQATLLIGGKTADGRLRARRRASCRLHRRRDLARRSEERSVRVPAKGSFRRPVFQRDATRDRPWRPITRLRKDQEQEQGRKRRREMAPAFPTGARRRPGESRGVARRTHWGAGDRRCSSRREGGSRQTGADDGHQV